MSEEIYRRSTDRELGEITAAIKNLKESEEGRFKLLDKKIDDHQKSTKDEIERLVVTIEKFRDLNDSQARKDYEYLDDKIGKLTVRILPFEKFIEGQEIKKKGWGERFKTKLFDVGSQAISLAVIGFLVWLGISYIQNSLPQTLPAEVKKAEFRK